VIRDTYFPLSVDRRSNHRIWRRLAIQFVFWISCQMVSVPYSYSPNCATDVISQVGLPTFIVYMAVYAPLVLLCIMGTIAVIQVKNHLHIAVLGTIERILMAEEIIGECWWITSKYPDVLY
jgi:hypothetical protein